MEPGWAAGQLCPQFSKKSRSNIFRSVVSAVYDCEASHGYGMTFSLNQNLKQHKDTVHLGIRYSCNECDMTFSWNKCLKRHKENVHSLNH